MFNPRTKCGPSVCFRQTLKCGPGKSLILTFVKKPIILTFVKKLVFRKDTTSGLYLTTERYQSCLD